MPNIDPSKKFRPWKNIIIHISIATEQITVQEIPQKLLSKFPPEFSFFSPDAYAVPGVRGTPLTTLHRWFLHTQATYIHFNHLTNETPLFS